MRLALFSDVHGNAEALDAVLEDLEQCEVAELCCLGDVVGYGADSCYCLDRIRRLRCPLIKGNHDEESARERLLADYSVPARAGVMLARSQLADEEKKFLRKLPYTLDFHGCTLVHSSLKNPADFNYILDERAAAAHFHFQKTSLCFHGHTHVPIVWLEREDREPRHFPGDGTVVLEKKRRYNINVGSVGQPRDFDPRACYVIFDTTARRIEYRRVPYNIEKSQIKIMQAGLPSVAAARLAKGR